MDFFIYHAVQRLQKTEYAVTFHLSLCFFTSPTIFNYCWGNSITTSSTRSFDCYCWRQSI